MEKMPEFCNEVMLEFLDDLRDSGVVNMYGAATYIRRRFSELTDKQATDVLLYWMHTFEERHG